MVRADTIRHSYMSRLGVRRKTYVGVLVLTVVSHLVEIAVVVQQSFPGSWGLFQSLCDVLCVIVLHCQFCWSIRIKIRAEVVLVFETQLGSKRHRWAGDEEAYSQSWKQDGVYGHVDRELHPYSQENAAYKKIKERKTEFGVVSDGRNSQWSWV